MKKIKTVLIDDNPHAIIGLKEDIARWFPQLEIVGTAEGVVEGAKLLRQTNPDLLFLDIHMGDGTGFDLLEIVPDMDFQLVFTTAHDEHALRAFQFAAVDYLLKPIDPEELKRAVERVVRNKNKNKNKNSLSRIDFGKNNNEKMREVLPVLGEHFGNKKNIETIALHTSDRIHLARINEIVRMEASGNYTHVFFASGQKLLLTKTLKEFSKLLEPIDFLRCHQSHLVNMRYVREFVKTDGGYIVMSDGSKVGVSVRKRGEVLERMGK